MYIFNYSFASVCFANVYSDIKKHACFDSCVRLAGWPVLQYRFVKQIMTAPSEQNIYMTLRRLAIEQAVQKL